jgi:hypothetical protein
VVAKKVSIGVQEAEKSVADMTTSPDYLGTRIEGIDSELKTIDEKVAPVDLKGIENSLILSIATVDETNKSLAKVENGLHVLNLYAKIFVGLGAVGVLILLRYALWVMRVF